MSKSLRLLLGDQLNIHHSWFKTNNDSVTYVLMEIRTETDYAKHHIQKVVGFFSAMQAFASDLQSKNHTVIYIHLNDPNNLQSFENNLSFLISEILSATNLLVCSTIAIFSLSSNGIDSRFGVVLYGP